MLTRTIILILPFIMQNVFVLANGYDIRITSDSPIVKGATIHFLATVYEGNKISDNNNFRFFWKDDGIPQHTRETDQKNATDSWVVTYDADKYAMGIYIVNVVVEACKFSLEWWCNEIGSARSYFEITETVSGKMLLVQNNQTMDNEFVSNSSTVTHELQIKDTDLVYIKNATTLFTYWFVDCTYYGITTDLKFSFNYSRPDKQHSVEALLVADFTPLPPTTTVPPSTTSTTKPTTVTTTTKPTSITTTTTVTTRKPTTNVTGAALPAKTGMVAKILRKRNADTNRTMTFDSNQRIMTVVNGTLVPYNISFPYVCNGTLVTTDSNKSYGYYYREVKVKMPITRVNVTGNNWIQHGNMLRLNVQCQGSRNIEYCIEYRNGPYNVTGNETCSSNISIDTCKFSINRYLSGPKYTVLIIIRNEVSKVVQPVTVTFYEVQTQPQLSVIVVPVAFTLVAVVLIVFGIAYYFQNRSRFIIEVADFNFGQQYSDMEYKTFRERLRDSIVNAFTRGPSPSSSEVPVWPPGRKYGSMT